MDNVWPTDMWILKSELVKMSAIAGKYEGFMRGIRASLSDDTRDQLDILLAESVKGE